ncbi:hypothetical protein LGM35_32285 [Burkholderia cenocepacia]|nr:hypothetical protein [Burkholderia cenocepacia]
MRRTTGKQKTKTKPPHGDVRRRVVHRGAAWRIASHRRAAASADTRRTPTVFSVPAIAATAPGIPASPKWVDAAGADRIDLGELARMPTVVTLFDRLIKTAPRHKAGEWPRHLGCASTICRLLSVLCMLLTIYKSSILMSSVENSSGHGAGADRSTPSNRKE